MKLYEAYRLVEEIKPADGIFVFDIDDTMLRADGSMIKIWKRKDGKETPLSTDEFAKDPDKGKSGVTYDYREFRDPDKVYNSIMKGTPILKNLKMMDAHVRAKWPIAILTARGLVSKVAEALKDFLKFRDKDGQLKPIGDNLKIGLSKAINDEKYIETFGGLNDFQKKAKVLKDFCDKYSIVKFVDDDLNNCKAAKSLGCKNLQVIVAHK